MNEIIKEVDIIEIMPDCTSVQDIKILKQWKDEGNIELSLHCLKSSLGSIEGYNEENIEKYYYINEYISSLYFSDHVAFSYDRDTYLSTVQPLTYNEETVEIMVHNLKKLQNIFPDKLLIENITNDNLSLANDFLEGLFFEKIIQKMDSNVKVLFDLTNAIVTAHNNGIAETDYIQSFPLSKIECIHVSGYQENGKKWRDTHTEDINDHQLHLLEKWLPKMKNVKYLLVERDFNVHCYDDVKNDIIKLKNFGLLDKI